MSNQTISHLSKVSVNSCEKLRDTTHTDSKLSTNTEDANYVTPSKINPPAQQSDEPRSATDIVESRLATPRNSSIDRSMSAVCNERVSPKPRLAPAQIPLFYRRSPRLNIVGEQPLVTPEKASLPKGPRTAPSGPRRRGTQPLKTPGNLEKFLAGNRTGRLTRQLSTAPNLERNLEEVAAASPERPPSRREEHAPVASRPAKKIVSNQPLQILDPPALGPPFEGMAECNEPEIPMVNALSTIYFQKSYRADDLPAKQLKDFMQGNCMQAQLEAREKESSKMARPNVGAPSAVEIEDLENQNVEFCEDVQNKTPSGEIYYTNDSQRLCIQPKCDYLALTKLERINGESLMLQYCFCSRACQMFYANSCLETAKKAGTERRFLFPHATHERRMSSKAWIAHKRRFAMEQKSRQAIATAFEAYERWYGRENAEQVKSLAGGDPADFAKDPSWPSYSERTKVGPLIEEPTRMISDGEVVTRASARCQPDESILGESELVTGTLVSPSQPSVLPTESDHESGALPSSSRRCERSDSPSAAAREATAPENSRETSLNEEHRDSRLDGLNTKFRTHENTSHAAGSDIPVDDELLEKSVSVHLLAASHGTHTSNTAKVTSSKEVHEIPSKYILRAKPGRSNFETGIQREYHSGMPIQLNNAENVLSTREKSEEEKLPIIADSDECGDPKDYGSSKRNRKEKSRAKNPERPAQIPASNFPRAKQNATLHPNLTEEKHYHSRVKDIIAEGKVPPHGYPFEERISKIIRVEDHHANERERLFLYCITENDENPRYLSLQRSCTLNESLVLSYLYVNNLTIHPECKKLGIDEKIRTFIKMLDLDGNSKPNEQYQRSYHENGSRPDNSKAAAGEIQIEVEPTATNGISIKPTDTQDNSAPSAFTSHTQMSRKVDIPMICRHTYDSDAVERQEAPPKDQRKQVASHRIPGRGSSQQPARNFRMATSPHVEEQRAIEAHKQEEAEANYAAFTNYSGTKDREIPTARRVDRAYSLDEYYGDNFAAFTNHSGTKDHENATDAARDKSLKQHEDDKEFVVRAAAEPSSEKKFRGAHPVVRKDSWTRQNSAEINQKKRERSDDTTGSKETESRTRAKGESSSYRSRHASSSTRSAPNQNDSSSDSEDDRRQPSRHVDKNTSDDRGTGDETSDTDDYMSPVESSSHPHALVGAEERASSPAFSDSGGSLSDSASDSDDSSSDSVLDVRASQRKAHRRRREMKRGKPLKAHRRNRSSRSESPAGDKFRIRSRSRSPVSRDRSKSPEPKKPMRIERHKDEPSWKADYNKWSKIDRRSKADRSREHSDSKSQHKPAKKRKKIKRESLSSMGTIEHVHLGVIAIDLTASSDNESEEMEIPELMEMPEVATLAAGSTSSSESTTEPPQEFFDELLERPEHVARIKESGLDRAVYLAKVIKAPNASIGELFYDYSKKKHIDKERERIPRSLQYPEKLTANAQFRPGNGSVDTIVWRKNFMSECTWVKEKYLTPLCLRVALDPKVSAAVRSNFSREKFKGKYEAEKSDLIPFEDICIFLKKTYDRPGRLEHALLDYLTLSQGKGTVRDLITTRTNKLGILSRLGAEALPEDLDRALILRALSAPLSEYIASRHNHLKYSVDEILRICKTRELAVNNASRSARNESLNTMSKRGNRTFSNPRTRSNNRSKNRGHLNAAIFKKKQRVTSRRPNKASLFAFGNNDSQPRISTRLFRTNYSDAEWNVRVGPDGKIKPGVNPKDPRHRNSFNKDTVQGKPWCLICKKAGHDMTSCQTPPRRGGKGKGKGKGKGQGGQRNGGRGQGRGNNFRR